MCQNMFHSMLNTKTVSSNLALVTTGNPPKNTPMEYSHLPPGSEYLQTFLECLQTSLECL